MTTKSRTAKLAAGFVGFAMAVSAFVPAMASADTASDLQAQINSLLATISSLQSQLAATTGGSSVSTGYTFNTNLTVGSTGTDVKNLQKVLNMSADTKVAVSGAGSPGMETSTFGPATKAAVIKFQTKYGISPAAGYVGAITRAKLNSMGGSVSTTPTTPGTTLPTGGALSVSAGSQPANSLAPQSAARIPFTTVVLTAGSSDVTVNSITVERSGLAQDAVFAGVVLLDNNGMQIGIAKTLNSNHQAMVGEPFVVKAGTSKTVTVAGNMASSLSSYAGQVAGLNVVAVNTSASVSGSLPISGAQHTINASLTLGTASMAVSSYDPNGSQTKEIGTTNYKFSGVRVTAGSGEQTRLWSIRWNQTGSASSQDLANVKVYVDGTSYDTTVSADGKYYSASFSGGILIDKGMSKEVYIQGDIVGTGSAGRTVKFDIYKTTDIYVSGVTYGYGITPTAGTTGSASDSTSEFTTGTPFFDGSKVTVSAGSVTAVQKASSVPAANIAVNVANQVLGGFTTDIKGEPISVQSMAFTVATSSGSGYGLLTSVTIVDSNGAVVAGPIDASGAGTTLTFTDSVTFPVGVKTYTIKGKVASTIGSGTVYTLSSNPSTGWSNITGQTTGNTITLSNGSFSMNAMTVKTAALAISVSSQPSARNVIAGVQGFEFARYVLDAGQSGEDVKLSNFKALLALGTITASQLSNCNLYDGSTNLTDGTSITLAAGDNTFTFNNGGFIVPKGTAKTISMKCNLSTGATSGTVAWGLTDNSSSYTSATGYPSNLTVSETMSASAGQTMTATTGGSYTVTADSALLYKVAQAGSTGVELARFRFTAGSAEAIDLKQIALVLGNTASNSPADLMETKVTLWNGATQVGTAQFGGSNPDHATSTLTSNVRIAAGESVVITVKGDLSAQNANEGTPGAFLTVNYNGDNNGNDGNYAMGVDSQAKISGSTTGAVSSNGLRIFRTVPTVAVTSNGGTLVAGGDLYKFTVTNPNNRDVVFQKFSFSIATSGSASINSFTLYGNEVAFNTATSTSASETLLEIVGTGTSQAQIVPANSTKTYVLRASTVTNPSTTVVDSITLALLADTSYPSIANLMGTVASVEAGSGNQDNIIWSPFSTTTPEATVASQSNLDWTNGYGMPGFPSNAAFTVQTWNSVN